jgi:hypothetical protein
MKYASYPTQGGKCVYHKHHISKINKNNNQLLTKLAYIFETNIKAGEPFTVCTPSKQYQKEHHQHQVLLKLTNT